MTITQQWEEEGTQKDRQEGLQEGTHLARMNSLLKQLCEVNRLEGLQEGVLLGKIDLLLYQLWRRFGNIPTSIRVCLQFARPPQKPWICEHRSAFSL